jgi:ABC-type multidrug transport system fused ATPase/permease subunit
VNVEPTKIVGVSEVGRTLTDSVKFAISLASVSERRVLLGLTFLISIVGLLDVVGVVAIAAAATSLLSAGEPDSSVLVAVPVVGSFVGKSNMDPVSVAVGLMAFGVSALLLRTLLSIAGTRFLVDISYRISERVANRLWLKFLAHPQVVISTGNSNNVAYALNYGATSAVASVIIASLVLASDAFLVVLLGGVVVAVSPLAGGVALLVFMVAGLLFVKVLSPRTQQAAAEVGDFNVSVDTVTRDGIGAYKEGWTSGTLPWFTARLEETRGVQLRNSSRLQYFLILPRYAAEIVLLTSLVSVGTVLFLSQDRAQAAASLVAFAAASSRIMPAAIRIQTSLIQIRMGSGQGLLTYRLVESLAGGERVQSDSASSSSTLTSTEEGLIVRDVSYAYPNSSWGLTNVSLNVAVGNLLAIVGPSGAGKSTLANLIMGLHSPDDGEILLLGRRPSQELFERGLVAYVPQDARILHATVRDNICLGRDISDDRLTSSLEQVGLLEQFGESGVHLDSLLTEFGSNLSGGQRQRLGLARALVTDPKLVILDEATSALDPLSEEKIGRVIARLKGDATVIVIAHRLRTVRTADSVVYLERGRVLANGTFDEIVNKVPDFSQQARLSGGFSD